MLTWTRLLGNRVVLGALLMLGLALYDGDRTAQYALRWAAFQKLAGMALTQLGTQRNWIDTPTDAYAEPVPRQTAMGRRRRP